MIIANYLPQFYVTSENNEWWGEGFTEWTNLIKHERLFKAQDLFIPGELGTYNLLQKQTHLEQIKLAEENGIGDGGATE